MNNQPEPFTVTIPMKIIEAAALCADKNDVRPTRKSIHFHDGQCIGADGGVALILTSTPFSGSFSLPYEAAKWALKWKKEFDIVDVTVCPRGGAGGQDEIHVKQQDGVTQTFAAVNVAKQVKEGCFVNERHGECAEEFRSAFQAQYFGLITKISKVLGRPVVYVHMRGEQGTSIRFSKPGYGEASDAHLIMLPIRPKWLREAEQQPELKKAA